MSANSGNRAEGPVLGEPVWRQILNWPSTRMGWWSIGFLIAFLVFLILFYALVRSGQRGGETFFSNIWLAVSILSAAVSAIVSGILAGIAIARNRERSFVAFVAILLGFLIAIFTMGEVAFSH